MSVAKIKIKAKIDDVRYQSLIKPLIKTINLEKFDLNNAPSICIVRDGTNEIAISKWVSPKRTRSYPFARVYDTISRNQRATVIPVVKDEGLDGDRDFLQWDTICLMSLLQVSVIIGYYQTASKNPSYLNKVTNQKFDTDWVNAHIQRLLSSYQSDALHWNFRQLREELPKVIHHQIEAYEQISKITKVIFYNSSSLSNFAEVINRDLDEFMRNSRIRSEQAQSREIATIHVHERVETSSKSPITVTNIVGDQYFLTVDEVAIAPDSNIIYLVEGKHTGSAILPAKADIKDGLLKMILYTNLKKLEIEYIDEQIKSLLPQPVLRLTSPHIKLNINSSQSENLETWCSTHNIKAKNTKIFLKQLFNEAQVNKFLVEIKNVV
jgi:hypothetical protein